MVLSTTNNPWLKRVTSASPWVCLIAILGWVGAQPGAAQNMLSARFAGSCLSLGTGIAIPAIGLAITLAGGSIDLSAGAMVCFASVAMAKLFMIGLNPWAAAGLVVGATIALSLIQGTAVVGLRIPSVIVSTAGLAALGNAIVALAPGSALPNPESSPFNQLLLFTNPEGVLPIPKGFWLAILICAGATVLLKRSVYGRHLLASGSDPSVARLCGVPVRSSRLTSFGIAGILLGAGGLLQNSRLSGGNASNGVGVELDLLAAVFIGGASWKGGRVSAPATFLGAVVVAVMRAALGLAPGPSHWQDAAMAVFLICVMIRSMAPNDSLDAA
jgi:ribose transport system permease protein